MNRLSDTQVDGWVARLRNVMAADGLHRSDEFWASKLGLDPWKARQVLKAHRERE